MKLTDEAVEAAAKAHHHELYPWVLWENLKPESREYYRDEVRAPLAAALPHLEGAAPAIDRGALVALMNAHPIEAFNGSQVVCECNLTWVTNAEYRAHLLDTVLALIGDQS